MFNLATMMRPASAGFIYPYNVNYSVMIDRVDQSHLRRTNSGTSVDTHKFTVSFWYKQTRVKATTRHLYQGKNDSDNKQHCYFDTSDRLCFTGKRNANWHQEMYTNHAFRDTSGWYHIHAIYDCDNATAADRFRCHINGLDVLTELGGWASANYPNVGEPHRFLESGQVFTVGGNVDSLSACASGYLAQFYAIEGVCVEYDDFGQLKDGIWVPKAYVVGTNSESDMSFKLDFADSANLGNDVSVNAADFTEYNMSSDHQSTDTPTNNICIWNRAACSNQVDSLGEGGKEVRNASADHGLAAGSMLVTSGKWYFEHVIGSTISEFYLGLVGQYGESMADLFLNSRANGWAYHPNARLMMCDGTDYYEVDSGGNSVMSELGTYLSGDILQIAFDADTGDIWYGVNNTWNTGGSPADGTGAEHSLASYLEEGLLVVADNYGSGESGVTNFGAEDFTYTPPTGFKALTYANLPEPSEIANAASSGMWSVYWEGTGAVKSITGLDFQPDLVIIKNLDATDEHLVFDSSRGATYPITIPSTSADAVDADTLTSFDSGGFSIGADVKVNTLNETYYAFCLKKSANYGFDIQTYTGNATLGRTVAHNLGVAPNMVWVWNRTDVTSIAIYSDHNNYGSAVYDADEFGNYLNTRAIPVNTPGYWNDTPPDASNVTLGNHNDVNGSGDDMIMYAFANVEGFSKVFTYKGNGNANGAYVYCGFKPRFILGKVIDYSNAHWFLIDLAIHESVGAGGYNPITTRYALQPSAAVAQALMGFGDITSNGFKILSTGSNVNYLNKWTAGIAFAEMPAKFANAF